MQRTFRIQDCIGREGASLKISLALAALASILIPFLSSFGASRNHAVSVTPTSINFGNQPVNTTTQQTITITNSGTHALQIQSVSVTGSSAFTLTGWTGQTWLYRSSSLQLGVSFAPTAQGDDSAMLTIYTNVSVDPVISITGVGIEPNISISPTSAVVSAGNSQQFNAKVTSSLATSVNWMVNGMPGGNPTVGTISGNGLYTAPNNVSSNSSATVTAADGTSQANASVTIVPAPTAVSVSISPTGASVQVGLSQQFAATVSGTTNTAVNWLVSGIAGGNSTVGTISSTGLYTAPSSAPASAVIVTAQSVDQSTSLASATVAITQALIAAVPTSVSFGSVTTGNANSQPISVKNAGTANLTVSSASVSGTGFSATGLSTPLTITPGNSSTFSVGFDPSSVGSVSGSVSLTSNAPGSQLVIPLSGSGVAATQLLGANPTSLAFGNVSTGGSSTLGVTLTNNGSSNVMISGVTSSGGAFSASGVNPSTTLTPSQTAVLNVTFAPTTVGSASGSVSVASNATNSPTTVSLSGTGMAPSGLDLTPPNCGISSTAAIVPNASAYTNFTPPPVGGTYTDPGGYCTVKRITNHGGQMTPFYSLVQAISAGDTKILGFDGYNAHWWIWDFNGNLVISGPTFDSAANENAGEPRWDYQDDTAIWMTSGNSVKKCTITMGVPGSMSCSVTHTFSEYSQGVVFPADSDMNANGWVPMAGQNVSGGEVEIFMFQPSTNTKAGVYDFAGCTGAINTNEPGCIHRLIATPNNGMTIEGPGSGDQLWDPPFSGNPVTLDPTADHHSVGWALDGATEVAAFEDFAYNTSGGPCFWRPVVVVANKTSIGNCPLVPNSSNSGQPPEFGWHVNYFDYATRPWIAWTMMSNGTGPDFWNSDAGYAAPVAWNQSGGNWYPYQGEVVLTRVDSSVTSLGQTTTTVFRLALHHARQDPRGTGNYWSDVFAPISRDGKYVVFGSNSPWAASGCPAGVGSDCSDIFLIGPLY
jgi:hypothetical protein